MYVHSGLTGRIARSYAAKNSFARTRSRLALPYCLDWPRKTSVRMAGDQIIMAIRQQQVGVSPEDALAAEEQSNVGVCSSNSLATR